VCYVPLENDQFLTVLKGECNALKDENESREEIKEEDGETDNALPKNRDHS